MSVGRFPRRCTDLPDEEGTETRVRLHGESDPAKRCTDLPDEEGTETAMNRAGCAVCNYRCTDLPDEEGTETLRVAHRRRPRRRGSPISSMRRGLSGGLRSRPAPGSRLLLRSPR